jgi:predicted acylesterase/phospholipase RssA
LLDTAGETIDAIYMVVSGPLKMLAKNQSGGQPTVRYISAADQFGALMLFQTKIFPSASWSTKSRWDRMLRKYLHDWRLEQLPIPVAAVTTDLVRAEAVERTTGDAVHAILESINLPVLSPPIRRDGKLLVDGGVVNNLPVDLLVKQGSNFVIGVDVAAHVEQHVGDNFPDTPTEQMKAPGIVATMLRCLRVQAHNMSAVGADPADVIIAPDVSDFEPTAFAKTPEMAEIGYRATNEALPRIIELLQELDGKLFA